MADILPAQLRYAQVERGRMSSGYVIFQKAVGNVGIKFQGKVLVRKRAFTVFYIGIFCIQLFRQIKLSGEKDTLMIIMCLD